MPFGITMSLNTRSIRSPPSIRSQRLDRIAGAQHAVADLFEQRGGDVGDLGIVLDHQDGAFGARRRSCGSPICGVASGRDVLRGR